MRACADAITFSCDTLSPQQFHEFQPMGGVSPICLPTFSVKGAVVLPSPLVAVSSNR